MTEREEIDARLKELYTTGVPVPFECRFAAKVNASECSKIEHALHTAFAPNRVNANREFFRIQPEQAIAILELFHHEDVTEEITEEIQNDLTDEDKAASSKAKAKRPPLSFFEMGMKVGDKLLWKDDPSIFVVVSSERKVSYDGEETSISSLSAKLKGYNTRHIAPGKYWIDESNRLLDDIYDETYPMEE